MIKKFKINSNLNLKVHFLNSLDFEKNNYKRFLIFFLIRNGYRNDIYEKVDIKIFDILKVFVNHFERRILMIFEKEFKVLIKDVIVKAY